ncbi:hypothetical protein EBU95_17660 [bacterium]|nr:hypothetical protein [bacterium]
MSYSNNPRSILAGTGITITPTTGTGSNTITVSASGTTSLAVRIAVATPIAVNGATDDVISVQVPGPVAVAVNLPAGVLGASFTIKDGLGLAAPATPITITPAAGTIDGAATAVINAPFGSLTFVYDGVQWLII